MNRIAALALLALLPRAVSATPVTEVHYVMGTYFRITAAHDDAARARTALRRCFATARQLDELFSRFDPHSELSRLNATVDTHLPVTVSAEMAALLTRAQALQTATHGAFDVSVARSPRSGAARPSGRTCNASIQARQTTGGAAFVISGTQLRRQPGVRLDLDGVAKGWAVDRCVAQFARRRHRARVPQLRGEQSLRARCAGGHGRLGGGDARRGRRARDRPVAAARSGGLGVLCVRSRQTG